MRASLRFKPHHLRTGDRTRGGVRVTLVIYYLPSVCLLGSADRREHYQKLFRAQSVVLLLSESLSG